MKSGLCFIFSGAAMRLLKRQFILGGLVLSALLVSAPVYAAGHIAPVITSGTTATGRVGVLGTLYTITAMNSPTSYTVSGSLPPGTSLDTVSGVVSGTPTTDGSYSATFTATNGVGTSAPVTVTFTIGPVDVTVVGLFAAQADTARRFSRAQISNFQHRMESLHRRGNNQAGASPGLAADASRTVTAGSTAAVAVNRQLGGGSDMLPNNSPLLLANNVVALLTTQSVNLSSLADQGADGSAGVTGVSNYWVEGTVNFGTREATGGRSGLDFTTSGISIGVDRRFSDKLAMGVGFGFARDKTDIGNDGSLSRTHGSSIAVYGSYQPSRKTFVDGMIGAGTLNFETQRYVSAVNGYARSDRDGRQIFGSLAAGYEYRDNGLLMSPYARLDYSTDRLKQSTETGAGQFDLSYFSQSSSATQGALGVRAESVHPTSFGYAAPRIRAEYQHNFQGERLASVSYADQPGVRYAIPTGAVERNAIVLGVGNDFVMRNGATFGIDYQYLHSFSQDTNYAVLLRFSKDLDERGTKNVLGGSSILPADSLGIQVDAGYMFDDNVTRATAGPDKHADRSYSVNLGKTIVSTIGDNARALLTGSLGGEKFHNYDGLSLLTAGVQGELQYRSSAEFSTPIFGIFARTSADQYNSDLRDGYRYSSGISMRQPVTDRIRLFGALAHNGRNGRSAVFDTKDNSARLNLDYELSSTSTLYLGGDYRRGDVVTAGPSTGVYSANVVSAPDDALPNSSSGGGQISSYRLDGKTVITTLGYNIGFGPRDAIDFSLRRIRSTLDAGSSGLYASNSSASSYTANQYTVVYLVRF